MKTLFNGKGKLLLTVLVLLCTVFLSCAAFVCLFNSNSSNNKTARADVYADIFISGAAGYWFSWEDGDIDGNETTETEIYLYCYTSSSRQTIEVKWSDTNYENSVSTSNQFSIDANKARATISVPANVTPGNYMYIINVDPEDGWWGGDIPFTSNPLSIHLLVYKAINSVSISGNSTVAYGSSLSLSGSGVGSLSWSISNGTGSATLSSTSGSNVTLNPTKAGTVYVTLRAAGDSMTSSGLKQLTVTIQRKGVALPTLSRGSNVHSNASVSGRTATTTYNGLAQHFTISNTTNINFGTPTSGATRSGNDFYATNARSGAYTVTVSLTSTTNYCWGSDGGTDTASKTLSLTINKASYNMTGVRWNYSSAFTYDGSAKTVSLTGLPSGVTAHYSNNSKTAAGSYTASVTFSYDTTNYNAPSSISNCNWVINKATPVVNVSVAGGNHYIGNTISTVGISGSANVSGMFAWTNPSQKIEQASASYGWIFTPNDTSNYNTVTGNATVVAVPPLDYITISGAKNVYKAFESFTTSGMTVTAVGGGTSKVVTGYTVTIPYTSAGRNYFLVADNGCKVTVTYTEGNVTKSAEIEITVNKADYDLSGVTFRDVTVTYDGQPHGITVLGSLPQGVNVSGYTYDGSAGTSRTEAGSYTVAPVINIDDTVNYNVPVLSAILLIEQATPVVSVNVGTGTFYVGDLLSGVAISIQQADVPGSVEWTSPDSAISGLAVKYGWTFTPDDTKNYKRATGSVTVNAVFKLVSIEVTSGKTDYKAFDALDTDSLVITATYAAGTNPTAVTGYTFTYPGDNEYFTVADDGKKVTFTYTENGITKTCTLTVSVGKKTLDMSGVSMTDKTETYDGNEKYITVDGTLPNVLSVTGYLYNGESATGATDAGSYKVEAVFSLSDPDNYVMPKLSANLSIGKATPVIDVSGVKTTFTYNGAAQGVTKGATVDNDEQTIVYENKTFVTVEEGDGMKFKITVAESKNYKAGSATVTITVEKAKVNLTWTGGGGKYDGEEHNATLEVSSGVFERDGQSFTTDKLADFITVEYSTENGDARRVKVGVYAPSLTSYPDGEPFCNYEPNITNEDYTFEITADSVSGITFESKSEEYNGQKHVIGINGTLPEEVTVKYYYKDTEDEFNGVTDVLRRDGAVAGYEITAVFVCESGNYEVPEDMTAQLTVTPRTISEDEVSGVKDKYTYIGKMIEVEPTVKLILTGAASQVTLVNGTDYEIEYSTEVYAAGTSVDVTVSGIGNYDGSVTLTFTIEKSKITMEWEDGGNYVYSGSAQGVGVKFNGIAESDADTVVPSVTYVGRGGTEYAESAQKPVNAGYYTVHVKLNLTNPNYENFIPNFKHFEIKKAQVSVSVDFVTYKEGDTVYAGSALPEIELQGMPVFGSLPVPGTVEWQKTNGTASAKVGTNEYVWVFTPDDGTNFGQSNGKLTVTAVQANILSITVEWKDGAQPELFTSTTLESVRDFLIVTGILEEGLGTVEIADYEITGSWGDSDTPESAGVYFYTIALTSDDSKKELLNDVEYKEVLLIEITVKSAGGSIQKQYTAFDEFDRDGIKVTAVYNDGNKVPVTDYEVIYPEERDCFWAKENEYQKVIISYNDGTLAAALTYEIDGITVLKKDFDTTGITLDEERTVTFDGTNKAYGIKGVFDIGTVSYAYAKWNGSEWVTVPQSALINAGTYRITASFALSETSKINYNEVKDMTSVLTVKKAAYDVDSIIFEDTVCDYGFGESIADKIKVENVPDGVSVEYIFKDSHGRTVAPEDVKNAGEYTVTVKFTVDENHEHIELAPVKFTVNKFRPVVNPQVSGSLKEGAKLYELTIGGVDGEVSGKFEWDNAEYELKEGMNRCYYTFTPDDTRNFEVVKGYVTLPASAADIGGDEGAASVSPVMLGLLIAGITVVLIVAAFALVVAIKASKRGGGDNDGFYDSVKEDDLK